jgi:hypothetical protein
MQHIYVVIASRHPEICMQDPQIMGGSNLEHHGRMASMLGAIPFQAVGQFRLSRCMQSMLPSIPRKPQRVESKKHYNIG